MFKRRTTTPHALARVITQWGKIAYREEIDYMVIAVPKSRKTSGIMVSNKETDELDELLEELIQMMRKRLMEQHNGKG